MMTKKLSSYVVLVLLSLLLFAACEKKDRQQSGQFAQQEGIQTETTVQTIKPKAINYDSMLVVIGDLTKAVKENPTDINLRQKLVATCYDTTWETILAAGFGEPTQKAATQSVSAKYMEQAAEADAYRWAAYIKKWRADPTTPDVGTISADIKGGRVVAKKHLPDNTVVALVEISSSKIF